MTPRRYSAWRHTQRLFCLGWPPLLGHRPPSSATCRQPNRAIITLPPILPSCPHAHLATRRATRLSKSNYLKKPSYCGPEDTRAKWCGDCAGGHPGPGAVALRGRLFGLTFARAPTPAEARAETRVGNVGGKRRSRRHCEGCQSPFSSRRTRWCSDTCGAKNGAKLAKNN